MLQPGVIALVLASPTDVFEEWSLVEATPLIEAVTVRASYHRADGDAALLPAAVQGPLRPTVHALGIAQSLVVTRGERGWQCMLPREGRASVRIVSQVTRAVAAPVLFRLRWPSLRANASPTRRVVVAPRALIRGTPDGWTCPDEPGDAVPCVSQEHVPGAVVTRVRAPRASRASVLTAWVLSTGALLAIAWSPQRRLERTVAALGGAAVALAVCLSVVGAHAASWAGAVAALLPPGMLIGAMALLRREARVVGAAALVAVPLVAIAGVPGAWVLLLAIALASAIVTAVLAR